MNVELWAGAPSPGASRPPLRGRERSEVRVVPPRSFGETMRGLFRMRSDHFVLKEK